MKLLQNFKLVHNPTQLCKQLYTHYTKPYKIFTRLYTQTNTTLLITLHNFLQTLYNTFQILQTLQKLLQSLTQLYKTCTTFYKIVQTRKAANTFKTCTTLYNTLHKSTHLAHTRFLRKKHKLDKSLHNLTKKQNYTHTATFTQLYTTLHNFTLQNLIKLYAKILENFTILHNTFTHKNMNFTKVTNTV